MIRHLRCLPFLLFLAFVGCYDVPFLIESESKAVINDKVLGQWTSVKQTDYDRGIELQIKRDENSPWYTVSKTDLSNGKVEHLRAIAHEINGSIIMSYNTKEDSDYSIFKIELTDKDLKAIALNEGAPQFKTKEEFVAFLSSKNSAEWFKEGYHFVRK